MRLHVSAQHKQKELDELLLKQKTLNKHLRIVKHDLHELDHALLKAKDTLQFVMGRNDSADLSSQLDYYRQLEENIEKQRDRFTVEICLQGMINEVEKRDLKLQQQQQQQQLYKKPAASVEEQAVVMKAKGVSVGLIKDWIAEEVTVQQNDILSSGRTLGYGFNASSSGLSRGVSDQDEEKEKDPKAVSRAFTAQVISLIVDLLVGRLNDAYNDRASALQWVGLKGRVFTSRFLYVLTWQQWQRAAVKIRDDEAERAWEQIFGADDPIHCARMAVEARIFAYKLIYLLILNTNILFNRLERTSVCLLSLETKLKSGQVDIPWKLSWLKELYARNSLPHIRKTRLLRRSLRCWMCRVRSALPCGRQPLVGCISIRRWLLPPRTPITQTALFNSKFITRRKQRKRLSR